MGKSSAVVWVVGCSVVSVIGCSSNTTQQSYPMAAGGALAYAGGVSGLGGVAIASVGGISNQGGALSSGSGGNSSGGQAPRGGTTAAGGAASGGGVVGGGTAKGGAGGNAGASGGALAAGGSLWRGPTPATATAKFPFPQNRFSANCTYPREFKNEDVQAVYNQWKTDLVTSDGAGGFRRVKRPSEPGLEPNSTVSEGIAYGMIIAVYMNDQTLFDDLWKYALKYPSNARVGEGEVQTMLMNWFVRADGTLVTNDANYIGAASDADEDMAWALIMADKQWGGQGQLSKTYLQYAKDLLNEIWKYEVLDGKLVKNGNRWGDWNNLNVSYFAPAYYRVFAKVSGNAAWGTDVVKCVYDTIAGNLTPENGNQTNGLVPAFSTATGGLAYPAANSAALRHDYQYDSCRTPFRIGLDACLFNDGNAKTYLGKISQFFVGIGAANIKDGYTLTGNPTPEYASRGYSGRSAAFIGPAGVGAMYNASYQSFVDDVWGLVRQNNMWCGGQYYDESWTMLAMLMLSGNFLDYTVETPR